MAKGKGKKKKSGIPLDVEQRLLGLSPTDLVVELTFERNAIEALTALRKNDGHIEIAEDKVNKLKKEVEQSDAVLKAKEAYDQAKADNTDDDLVQAKTDVSLLKKAYNDDIKDRKKILVYMEQMAKRHIESGALKRKK